MSAVVDNPSALADGTLLAQEFRLNSVLGAGGFGITYLAFDISLNTEVAIKEHFPRHLAVRDGNNVRPHAARQEQEYRSGLDRFVREARILSSLSHTNIVRALRIFAENGTAYIVLEYLNGLNMEDWLVQLGRRPSQDELDRFTSRLLDAVSLLHRNKVIHRDIKPANILIRQADTEPILLDFGSARIVQAAGQQLSSHPVLTPQYSPFESYTSDLSKQSAATDIYGFAATLYRALTGEAPPPAPDRIHTETMTPTAQVPGLSSNYRPEFLAAVDHGLSLFSQHRPSSIDAWRKALFPEGVPAISVSPPKGGTAQSNFIPTTQEPRAAEPQQRSETSRATVKRSGGRRGYAAAVIGALGVSACGIGGLTLYMNDQGYFSTLSGRSGGPSATATSRPEILERKIASANATADMTAKIPELATSSKPDLASTTPQPSAAPPADRLANLNPQTPAGEETDSQGRNRAAILVAIQNNLSQRSCLDTAQDSLQSQLPDAIVRLAKHADGDNRTAPPPVSFDMTGVGQLVRFEDWLKDNQSVSCDTPEKEALAKPVEEPAKPAEEEQPNKLAPPSKAQPEPRARKKVRSAEDRSEARKAVVKRPRSVGAGGGGGGGGSPNIGSGP